MGKRFQLSLKRSHVFFLQSYFGDRGRRLWNLSSLILGADVRRSRARPALRSACGDGPGLPVRTAWVPSPRPRALPASRSTVPPRRRCRAGAAAWGPETCVRVPGLECGGERPPKGGAPPPPGRPEQEAVGSRGGGATQSQRSRQRHGVTRAAPAEAASTPPAGVTCGLVSNGLKSFRAGVVYAATAHAPA